LSRHWRSSKLSVEGTTSSPSATGHDQISVTPVRTPAQLDAFIKLPWRLYAGNPNWVPPLLRLQRELFSPRHNAFYQHADVQLFLALRGPSVVGRISAHIDHEHNRFHGEHTGFFGFFEAENTSAVAGALLAAAEGWLRERGMTAIRGPLNFSTNGESGFLVEGFDSPPQVLMPYTQPYYLPRLEAAGYAGAQDLFAWRWERQPVPQGPARLVKELRSRPEISVRHIQMKRFQQEVRTMLDIYNDAWAENWGFVPATDAEAEQMARELKLIADPRIVPFVEVNGIPVAFALAVPNLNEAIHDLDGKLFPFGLLKLIWRLKVRRPRTGRLLLLGIKKEFRNRRYAGLAYLLCDEIYHGATQSGYDWAEFSWTLEENRLVNALITKIGCHRYKTYRIYQKPL